MRECNIRAYKSFTESSPQYVVELAYLLIARVRKVRTHKHKSEPWKNIAKSRLLRLEANPWTETDHALVIGRGPIGANAERSEAAEGGGGSCGRTRREARDAVALNRCPP